MRDTASTVKTDREEAIEVQGVATSISPARSIGIDVGGSSIKWVSMIGQRVSDSGAVATPRDGGDALISALSDLISGLDPEARLVGVAVPGLVDVHQQSIVFIPNIPGNWAGYPISAELAARTGRAVSVLNDARAFGLAELRLGAARGDSDAVFFTLGTGVGGAVARDGAVLMSGIDSMGEMGHVIVEPDGERCGCGGRGCLETVASASALVGSLTRVALTSLSPALESRLGGDVSRLSPELIVQAASEHDEWSLAALDRVGHALGIAASNACVILHLSTVVVGGGLAAAFPYFSPALETVLAERKSVIGDVAVRQAILGREAGAIGAALHATEFFTATPHTGAHE